MNKEQLDLIKKKYGHYASWAIWAGEGDKSKSNMGDLSIFEDKNILSHLNPNIILVGLNISKRDEINRPFENFHGPLGGAYKIRYAFKNSPYWGGYMTDVIKDFAQLLQSYPGYKIFIIGDGTEKVVLENIVRKQKDNYIIQFKNGNSWKLKQYPPDKQLYVLDRLELINLK